ncbi:MAG: FkbM family methyltransferase [Pseudomonadota bacterium]|nr:MAG: FkbM family methyltransferase [Pseudomonadota bacterium]
MCFAFINRAMIGRFRRGIENRLDTLAVEYLVPQCTIKEGDIVIDIGANIGEFTRYCCEHRGARVVAIEPENACEAALRINLKGLDAIYSNEALWCEDAELLLYHSHASNDTTLIEPVTYDFSETIRVVTLDGLMSRLDTGWEQPIDTIKLVKIEAEGAEPEIIAGGSATLARTHYVAVDCGPERGLKQESTLLPVVNALLRLGFRFVGFRARRMVVLMKNDALENR